jgi:hypothetical protein
MATATHHADAPGLNGARAETNNELRRRGKPSDDDRVARDGAGAEEDAVLALSSMERAFADQPVPSWREQLTVHAFVVSFFLAVMFSIIVQEMQEKFGHS